MMQDAIRWFFFSVGIGVLAGMIVNRSKVVQGWVLVAMILVAIKLFIDHLEPFIVAVFIGFCLIVVVGVYRTTIISRFGDREDEQGA